MKNLLFILCLVAPALSHAQLPSTIDTNGLVAYYPLDTNVTDAYIYHNNGINIGAIPVTDRFGHTNSAYRFNNDTTCLKIANSYTLSHFPNGQTVSMWLKIDTLPTDGKEHYIMWKQHDSPYSFYHLMLSNFTSVNQLIYRFGQDATHAGYGITPFDTLPVGEWFHYVMTTDTSHTYSYINGRLISDSANTLHGYFGVNTEPLYIGKTVSPTVDRGNFKGAIDDIAIYSRAFSSCDVQKLYRGLIPSIHNDTVMVGSNAFFAVSDTLTSVAHQWQVDTGAGYYSLVNDAVYSGVTTDTLRIANTTTNMDSNMYRCIIGLGTCADTSFAAMLIVDTLPVVTGVNQLKTENIIVYPSPAHDYLTILGGFISAELIDLTGRVILKFTTSKLSVYDIPNGNYLLKIRSENGAVVKKISIQH